MLNWLGCFYKRNLPETKIEDILIWPPSHNVARFVTAASCIRLWLL